VVPLFQDPQGLDVFLLDVPVLDHSIHVWDGCHGAVGPVQQDFVQLLQQKVEKVL
jgi:hypothetical protein